ncbi:MAG: DUF3883 domain-containing protein [Propionibacteriaceae bacterium]|jgi:hypothetical protein|nr:DUF3883 domain-containing protein [Propionibacteriaceae bacterium]
MSATSPDMTSVASSGGLSLAERERLVGLFLSKFNQQALRHLGFSGYTEAYNTLGYALGVRPSSLKNHRDEYDPYFPNPRAGWHKRAMKPLNKLIFDRFRSLDFEEFSELIESFLDPDIRTKRIVAETLGEDPELVEASVRRQLTGLAAETYFEQHHAAVPQFAQSTLADMRALACGFDYTVSDGSLTFYVEVKGLRETRGTITMTEREYDVATKLRKSYCLFIVSGFSSEPAHRRFSTRSAVRLPPPARLNT